MALDRPYPKIWRIGPKWAQSEALIQLEIVWTNLKSRDIILYSVNFCCREIGTVEHRGVFACIRPNCWWPSICWNAHTSSRIRATDNSRKIMMRLLAYWWKLVLLLLLIFFRAKVSPSKVLLLKSTASFSITFKTLGFSLSFSLNKPSSFHRHRIFLQKLLWAPWMPSDALNFIGIFWRKFKNNRLGREIHLEKPIGC